MSEPTLYQDATCANGRRTTTPRRLSWLVPMRIDATVTPEITPTWFGFAIGVHFENPIVLGFAVPFFTVGIELGIGGDDD